MNDRGLVDVPENAVRSESLAFGLSAPQLGILGAAAGFAAVANLLPLWLPAKVVLILVGRRARRPGGDPADPRRTGVSLAHLGDPIRTRTTILARRSRGAR